MGRKDQLAVALAAEAVGLVMALRRALKAAMSRGCTVRTWAAWTSELLHLLIMSTKADFEPSSLDAGPRQDDGATGFDLGPELQALGDETYEERVRREHEEAAAQRSGLAAGPRVSLNPRLRRLAR